RILRLKTLSIWEPPSPAPRASMRQMPKWRGGSAWGSSFPGRMGSKKLGMRARKSKREVFKPADREIKKGKKNGTPSKGRLQFWIPWWVPATTKKRRAWELQIIDTITGPR